MRMSDDITGVECKRTFSGGHLLWYSNLQEGCQPQARPDRNHSCTTCVHQSPLDTGLGLGSGQGRHVPRRYVATHLILPSWNLLECVACDICNRVIACKQPARVLSAGC